MINFKKIQHTSHATLDNLGQDFNDRVFFKNLHFHVCLFGTWPLENYKVAFRGLTVMFNRIHPSISDG